MGARESAALASAPRPGRWPAAAVPPASDEAGKGGWAQEQRDEGMDCPSAMLPETLSPASCCAVWLAMTTVCQLHARAPAAGMGWYARSGMSVRSVLLPRKGAQGIRGEVGRGPRKHEVSSGSAMAEPQLAAVQAPLAEAHGCGAQLPQQTCASEGGWPRVSSVCEDGTGDAQGHAQGQTREKPAECKLCAIMCLPRRPSSSRQVWRRVRRCSPIDACRKPSWPRCGCRGVGQHG